jgi:hypothetical protein
MYGDDAERKFTEDRFADLLDDEGEDVLAEDVKTEE